LTHSECRSYNLPMARLLFALFFFLLSVPVGGQSQIEVSTVTQLRLGSYPDHTRIVLDLTHPVSYRVIRSAASDRLSLYLSPAVFSAQFVQPGPFSDPLLEKIEIKESAPTEISLVLTHKPRDRYRIMSLDHPDRLVIDIYKATLPHPSKRDPTDTAPTSGKLNIQTIVIDPGHGGKDPGAIGTGGLMEKDVVLDVAFRLKTLLRKRLKKEVLLTRAKDQFIPLNERARLANLKKADLFVSIHVNASPSPQARGIEVYLFGRATDKIALATAARENAASHQTALDFEKMILHDMARDFTLNASLEFAHYTQEAFRSRITPTYQAPSLGVKHAPFYVLAYTQMPAILAEVSFISNPREERLLRSDPYLQALAEALYEGVSGYLRALQAAP